MILFNKNMIKIFVVDIPINPITNEKTITIICTAKGNFSQSTSPNELIETNWYSKDDVKKIISECTCASNVCLFSYLWINNFLNLKSLT